MFAAVSEDPFNPAYVTNTPVKVSALVILPAIVKLGCTFVNEPVIVNSGDCKPDGTALPPAVDVAVVLMFIVKVKVSEGLLCKKTNSSVILKL